VPFAIVFRGTEFGELSKSAEDMDALTLCVINASYVIVCL